MSFRNNDRRGSNRNALSTSPLAEQSILRDLQDEEEEEEEAQQLLRNGRSFGDGHHMNGRRASASRTDYSMIGSFRRPSAVAYGPRPIFSAAPAPDPGPFITEQDREAAFEDERSLLRDNEIIPPKHPRKESTASGTSGFLARKLSIQQFIPRRSMSVTRGSAIEDDAVDETTPLVRNHNLPYGGEDTPENIDKKWNEAVAQGEIQTTWQREAKVLAKYSRPLVFTFVLQYSLTVVSIFTVGHIGKIELGAASLGGMSANITGFAIFIGLATSLDTLCPQAYGSGKKQLVGLQMQRMVYFLWLITIPIACIWAAAPQILTAVLSEKEVAAKAGQYLRVLIFGAPGYAAFESGKRYVQAQGLFHATLYVLMAAAPINVFLHWLFVWKLEWGFIGAPIAIAIVDNLLPLFLFLYVRFVDGMECWPGFTRRAFKNWWPMIKLALPGLVMVLAEWLAFEILTLTSSYISSTHLATQSILSTISAITFQIPFAISIASSTRIANLIGATLVEPAKLSTKVSLYVALIVGASNMLLLIALRTVLPWAFTNDSDVAELTMKVLPLNAAFQLFDSLAALANGILRGLGRQEVGGYVNLICYYVIALPISFATAFGLHWDLYGLWAGPAGALGLVAAIELYFVYKMDWNKAVEAATARNEVG
ncbi:mate-domain-containing protein [Elsinoe ampelina]|uniref:Mate-domain-containing protein n=1 Tax=Elsinoe ampelina TaxID=302913 RepID=A0A6A6GMF6_9PEZI|nr:mate-domain-containing protein [Elsinoe ampelina]